MSANEPASVGVHSAAGPSQGANSAPSGGSAAAELTNEVASVGVHSAGWPTLLYKELLRFWKVSLQTIAAPIMGALLYLLIFSHVLEGKVSVYEGRVTYTAFLVPGLVMMAVLQNAFANSSSSLTQSKITGNLIFVLLTPLSPGNLFAAYVLGAMVRGLIVGLGVFAVTLWFDPSLLRMPYPLWAIAFALAGSAILGTLGLLAGLWADKFDQLSAFQNFIIMPLTMLSGVFYSIHSLPPFWQALSHWNPFFYMIDGFRYGFFGVSDVSPWASFAIVTMFSVALCATTLILLKRGWKLRH
jgi:ABC-2 type transport system permease protein